MARITRSSTGRASTGTTKEPQQLSSPPTTPAPASKGKPRSTRKTAVETPKTPATSKKRTRHSIKQEDTGDVNELPHNLGTTLPTPGADWEEYVATGPAKKRAKRTPRKEEGEDEDGDIDVKDEPLEDVSPKKTPKKNQNYGLTPGITPFPDYPRPTAEECHEVVRLLEKVHGHVEAPKAIPPPSLDVSGCGEVPSVLDALVRTRLSANTTNKNSSTAFQGLVARFGTLKEGIGKGSVDWDAVRRAPQRDVFKAIERGGLADRKSKDIQAILQLAYEENQER